MERKSIPDSLPSEACQPHGRPDKWGQGCLRRIWLGGFPSSELKDFEGFEEFDIEDVELFACPELREICPLLSILLQGPLNSIPFIQNE